MPRQSRVNRQEEIAKAVTAIYGEQLGQWGLFRNPKNGDVFVTNRKPCKCNEKLGTFDDYESAIAALERHNAKNPRHPERRTLP